MNADWMQARIAELERVNAALVAERDAAVEKQVHWMEVSTSWVNRCAVAHRERDAAVRELGVEVERRLMAVRDVNYLADQCHLLRRWSALWKRAAKAKRAELVIADDLLIFHQDMRVALPGFVTPYTPDDPDADELAPFGWIPVPKPGQWQPGTTAGKDCRGNVGQGYERGEG